MQNATLPAGSPCSRLEPASAGIPPQVNFALPVPASGVPFALRRDMATSRKRKSPTKGRSASTKYGEGARKSVKSAVERQKAGTLKAGAGRHPKAKTRKQAIAIGLSEARKKGAKVPRKSQ